MISRILSRILIACLCLWGHKALTRDSVFAADYYLGAAGDDARDGKSPDAAWRTIARANRQPLSPGDKFLFRGEETFEGSLIVKVTGTPSVKLPITIGSYGKGKATIRAGNGTAIVITNTGGVVVRDLIVEGKDRRTNHGSGVGILNTLPGGKQLDLVRVEQ